MSRHTVRVGVQIMDELARLLREDVSDPRIKLVTLTRIDVSPDMRNAIVFYSAVAAKGDVDIESIDLGLTSAAPFLRRRAAKVLPMKRMPELRFRYDPSLSLGSRTLGLLHDLQEEDGNGEKDPT